MYVKIKEVPNDKSSNLCYLPASVMKKLNLSQGKVYTVRVGQRTAKVFLAPHKEKENMYFLKSILFDLLLVKEASLNIWCKDQTFS